MLSKKEIEKALRKMIKENSGDDLDEAMADFGADKSMKEIGYATIIFDDLYLEVTGKEIETPTPESVKRLYDEDGNFIG